MITFLQINNIEMYSTHNEGKYFVAETFIRTKFINIWLQYQKMYILIN